MNGFGSWIRPAGSCLIIKTCLVTHGRVLMQAVLSFRPVSASPRFLCRFNCMRLGPLPVDLTALGNMTGRWLPWTSHLPAKKLVACLPINGLWPRHPVWWSDLGTELLL